MSRIISVLYGILVYGLFLGTFLYAIGFVGNLIVPWTIDSVSGDSASGASGSGEFSLVALLVNAGLLSVFAVQHSVMARPGFKRWWTQFVPKPVERTTYVLFASAALMLLYWQWRPLVTKLPELVSLTR